MKNLCITLLLLMSQLMLFAQDNSFNQQKGFIIGANAYSFHSKSFELSPMIGYKFNKLVVFTHYGKRSTFQENDIATSADDLDYYRNVLAIGCQIYPYKNLKKTRMFYQIHFSYKWADDKYYDSKFYMCNFGAGVETTIFKKLTTSCNAFLGIGHEEPHAYKPGDASGIVYDFGAAISVRYYLTK